jgi:hypothetical protein
VAVLLHISHVSVFSAESDSQSILWGLDKCFRAGTNGMDGSLVTSTHGVEAKKNPKKSEEICRTKSPNQRASFFSIRIGGQDGIGAGERASDTRENRIRKRPGTGQIMIGNR